MYHIFLINSSVDGYLGCFNVLAIIYSVSISIRMHILFWIMFFSGYIPMTGIAGSYGNCACMLNRFSSVWLCADYSTQGSPVHGILQARTLEWVAMPSSRGSSQPKDWSSISCVSCVTNRFFTTELPGKPTYGKSVFSFSGNFILFSKVAVPTYTPTSCGGRFSPFYTFSSISCLWTFSW